MAGARLPFSRAFTLAGRKHCFATGAINEDRGVDGDVSVQLPVAGLSSSTRVLLTGVLDGHGAVATGRRALSSAGKCFVELCEQILPAVVEDCLLLKPSNVGENSEKSIGELFTPANYLEQLLQVLRSFKERINERLMQHNADLCRDTGATICLAIYINEPAVEIDSLFCVNVGDACMVAASDDGRALDIWHASSVQAASSTRSASPPTQHYSAVTTQETIQIDNIAMNKPASSPTKHLAMTELLDGYVATSTSPKRRKLTDEYHPLQVVQEALTKEKALSPPITSLYCSYQDTISGYPKLISEGHTQTLLDRDYNEVKPFLRPFSKRLTPSTTTPVDHVLVSPASKFLLRMTNTLGNINHASVLLKRTTVYRYDNVTSSEFAKNQPKPEDENTRFTTPSNIGWTLVLMSDGIKDVFNADEIAMLMPCVGSEEALRTAITVLAEGKLPVTGSSRTRRKHTTVNSVQTDVSTEKLLGDLANKYAPFQKQDINSHFAVDAVINLAKRYRNIKPDAAQPHLVTPEYLEDYVHMLCLIAMIRFTMDDVICAAIHFSPID